MLLCLHQIFVCEILHYDYKVKGNGIWNKVKRNPLCTY